MEEFKFWDPFSLVVVVDFNRPLQCIFLRSWVTGKKASSLAHPFEQNLGICWPLSETWSVILTVEAHSPEACGASPLQAAAAPAFLAIPALCSFPPHSSRRCYHVKWLVTYLAANLSLTCNMQMLFSSCWVCSCCLFWGLSDFTWRKMSWCEGLEQNLGLSHYRSQPHPIFRSTLCTMWNPQGNGGHFN